MGKSAAIGGVSLLALLVSGCFATIPPPGPGNPNELAVDMPAPDEHIEDLYDEEWPASRPLPYPEDQLTLPESMRTIPPEVEIGLPEEMFPSSQPSGGERVPLDQQMDWGDVEDLDYLTDDEVDVEEPWWETIDNCQGPPGSWIDPLSGQTIYFKDQFNNCWPHYELKYARHLNPDAAFNGWVTMPAFGDGSMLDSIGISCMSAKDARAKAYQCPTRIIYVDGKGYRGPLPEHIAGPWTRRMHGRQQALAAYQDELVDELRNMERFVPRKYLEDWAPDIWGPGGPL